MTSDKTPIEQAVEQALDAFVYAPIGLLFDGADVFPKLVEAGKAQVNTARMFGQFAVQAGSAEAKKRVDGTQEQFTEQVVGVLSALGLVPPPPAPPKPEPAPAPAPAPVAEEPVDEPAAEPAPAAESLAVPDYDSLSASQVVSRLAGLADEELEAVRAYESANRGRKTVLNKIKQLQK